jgi:N-acetylmuramic acid 6-phosphate etherase
MPAARREIAALGDVSRDAVIAVSASGTTPYTVAAAQTARSRGAFVAGVACRPGAALLQIADAALLIDVGEEALRGSTRLAAGTAQRCALALISTLLGDALGHVCAGLMVNMQADNEKLRERAQDSVAAIVGTDAERTRAALNEAGGDVKRAVLIAAGARGVVDATRRLERWRGRIPPALEELRREAELKIQV